MNFDNMVSTIRLFMEGHVEFMAAVAAFIAFSLLLVLFFRSQDRSRNKSGQSALSNSGPHSGLGAGARSVTRPIAGSAAAGSAAGPALFDEPNKYDRMPSFSPDMENDFNPGADHPGLDAQGDTVAPTITPATIAEQFAAIDALAGLATPIDQPAGEHLSERPIAHVDDPEKRAALAGIEAELLSVRKLYQAGMIAPEIYLLKSRQIAKKLSAISS